MNFEGLPEEIKEQLYAIAERTAGGFRDVENMIDVLHENGNDMPLDELCRRLVALNETLIQIARTNMEMITVISDVVSAAANKVENRVVAEEENAVVTNEMKIEENKEDGKNV